MAFNSHTNKRSQRVLLAFLIALTVTLPIALGKATIVNAQSMATCLDVRVQYPNGVAKNKKVRGIKTFRKAVVDAQFYNANIHLDFYGNNNGIVCDPKETFTEIATTARVLSNFDGIEIELDMVCVVHKVELQYGFDVGYANLGFETRCDTTFKNKDKFYSYYVNGYAVGTSHLVYEDLVTNKSDLSRAKANVELERAWFSGRSVRPGGWLSERVRTKNWIVGTKAEIETLFQRMKNGLVPSLYIGRGWGEPQGCFTTMQRPPYENVKVAIGIDCAEYSASLDSDGNERWEKWRNVWD